MDDDEREHELVACGGAVADRAEQDHAARDQERPAAADAIGDRAGDRRRRRRRVREQAEEET